MSIHRGCDRNHLLCPNMELQVVKLILQGILLIPPDECPEFIYKVMAATWKTDPKDRTNFTDILNAFIDNNCTCRQRLASPSRRKGQATRRTSCELPCLSEVDEGADDETVEGGGAAGGITGRAEDDEKDAHSDARRNVTSLREQQENPYMVPVDLEVVVHSGD